MNEAYNNTHQRVLLGSMTQNNMYSSLWLALDSVFGPGEAGDESEKLLVSVRESCTHYGIWRAVNLSKQVSF